MATRILCTIYKLKAPCSAYSISGHVYVLMFALTFGVYSGFLKFMCYWGYLKHKTMKVCNLKPFELRKGYAQFNVSNKVVFTSF